MDDPKAKTGCSGKFCSVSRCQCGFLVILVLGLIVTVAVLAALYANEKNRSDSKPTVVPPVTNDQPWQHHRLPDYIHPEHYDLTLYPDFYDGHDSFYGNVTIFLNVTRATNYLLVHIRDLTVRETRLYRGGVALVVKETWHHADNEYWVVVSQETITPGLVSLYLRFEGSLVNGIVGLYKSVYVDSSTNETNHSDCHEVAIDPDKDSCENGPSLHPPTPVKEVLVSYTGLTPT